MPSARFAGLDHGAGGYDTDVGDQRDAAQAGRGALAFGVRGAGPSAAADAARRS